MASVKKITETFPTCLRCRNSIKPGETAVFVPIMDDAQVIHGKIHLCQSCGSSPRLNMGRIDLIADYVSNDLIEQIMMFKFNMGTWDACQKIESWIGSRSYCIEMLAVIKAQDPADALCQLYSRCLKQAQGG